MILIQGERAWANHTFYILSRHVAATTQFVDMKGSTQLSATNHEKSTAGAYQLFTGTAVRLFDAFDAPYINVRGDGVFALFDQDRV